MQLGFGTGVQRWDVTLGRQIGFAGVTAPVVPAGVTAPVEVEVPFGLVIADPSAAPVSGGGVLPAGSFDGTMVWVGIVDGTVTWPGIADCANAWGAAVSRAAKLNAEMCDLIEEKRGSAVRRCLRARYRPGTTMSRACRSLMKGWKALRPDVGEPSGFVSTSPSAAAANTFAVFPAGIVDCTGC